MAIVRDKELTPKFVAFPEGLNNVARETDLATGTIGDDGIVRGELRVAENIDLTDEGKPQTPPAPVLVEALPGLHSLWADPRYPFMLGVYDGNLVRFDTALERTVVQALTHAREPLSYDVGAGWVYWSSRYENGRISPEGEAGAFAPELPAGEPQAVATAAGGLDAGPYAVAVCFVDAHGRHGGTSLAVEVELTAGQGIALSHIPQPLRADTVAVRIGLTAPRGSVLRYVTDLPVGLTSIVLGAHTPGEPLRTDHLEPLPPGQCLAWWNARPLVLRGRLLLVGDPMRAGLANLAKSYLQFGADGVLLAAFGEGQGSGVYVATAARDGQEGSTYWLGGADPEKWNRVRCYPHGAVAGSLAYVDGRHLAIEGIADDARVPVWLADDGQLLAGVGGGRVRQLHRERYEALARPERAATALREYRGTRTLVASLRGGTVGRFRVTDTASAERWRTVNGQLVRVPDDA
jgi:hypothetical protein